MKYLIISFFAILLLFSCQKQSEISKSFNCESTSFKNLEETKDVKKLFTLQLPKSWKTNLYYDETQSSIYTADTTKQLTETLLLDVTFIRNSINFDEAFKLKQEQESLGKQLIQTEGKEVILLDKPSYYTLSKGKKGVYKYEVCQAFIKLNEQNFILAKAEIYGDSLVNKRMCEAISLIENIKINQ
ncbi:hypothetical protein H9W90_04625 [Polaribacter pectinis]|uniref:PsbP C-terminal domain-containing protein n=1 Tax=Polaribacter pectinis TaxID=2738844 RepID=A0A7G9LCR5_9FLAO|nr:hypothetical protein [Polaribacter pectinis]QNM86414.1 hypothetical protein H9W90_04625 [Polaribacter pectinis]